MKSQTPLPGSEAAVRHLFAGLLAGMPNYDEMAPQFAAAIPRPAAGSRRAPNHWARFNRSSSSMSHPREWMLTKSITSTAPRTGKSYCPRTARFRARSLVVRRQPSQQGQRQSRGHTGPLPRLPLEHPASKPSDPTALTRSGRGTACQWWPGAMVAAPSTHRFTTPCSRQSRRTASSSSPLRASPGTVLLAARPPGMT